MHVLNSRLSTKSLKRPCHSLRSHHLIVDGSNLSCFSRQMANGQNQSTEMLDAFRSYLEFFLLATSQIHDHGESQSHQSYIVFDSPQGADAGWRRQINSLYKVSRYSKRGIKERKDRDAPTPTATIAQELGFEVLFASPADEADDLIGSLAANIIKRSNEGEISIVSSDSDMIQLVGLSSRVRWLEILQWPTATVTRSHLPIALDTQPFPGLSWLPVRIHQSSSFPPPNLLPASLYCDWLALTKGKIESGVKGLGLSSSSAREILKRYPLGLNREPRGSALDEERLAEARLALSCIQMKISLSLVPERLDSPARFNQKSSISCREMLDRCLLSPRDKTSQLALLHPSYYQHVISAAPLLQAVSHDLTARGISHKSWQLTNEGVLIDIMCEDGTWIIILALTDFLPDTTDSKDLRDIKRSSPSHIPSALQCSLRSNCITKIKQAGKQYTRLSVIPFWEVSISFWGGTRA